ncbi:MAG: hypothetical protein E2O86_07485 [Bacteroidetes bacterium]|nr:MAG: hypothetical protein E2O86_07485 [Bacteroidota bacterium]
MSKFSISNCQSRSDWFALPVITSERSEGVIPSSLRMYFRTKKFVEARFSILLSEEMEVAKLRYKCIASIAFWDQQTCRQAG